MYMKYIVPRSNHAHVRTDVFAFDSQAWCRASRYRKCRPVVASPKVGEIIGPSAEPLYFRKVLPWVKGHPVQRATYVLLTFNTIWSHPHKHNIHLPMFTSSSSIMQSKSGMLIGCVHRAIDEAVGAIHIEGWCILMVDKLDS